MLVIFSYLFPLFDTPKINNYFITSKFIFIFLCMALKYFTEYRSLQTNSLWRIEIDSPTYTDEPIELIPGEKPLIMEWQGNNEDDPFKAHVINSTCQIQVFNDGLDLDELMLINDASYKCRVYHEGVLDWQGFVISDGIRAIDSGVPYVVTLKAIDGLELLDNVAWSGHSGWGDITVDGVVSDRRAPIHSIRTILYRSSNLDNILPIRWSVSLRNLNYPESDALGGQTALDKSGKLSLLTEKSAFWWLKNICQSVGCWIVQQHGFWYIYSYSDLVANDGTLDFWQIETTSTSTEVATSVTVDLNVDGNDFVNENASWWVKKPIGGVKVTYQNTTDDGNVIPNGDFDLWSLGNLVDWGFYYSPILPGIDLSINNYEDNNFNNVTIDGRAGYSADLKFSLQSDPPSHPDAQVSFEGIVPLDTNKLFKTMVFGFDFMPLNRFPFYTDGDKKGQINWESNPLRVKVLYSMEDYPLYLNGFGFWQRLPPNGFMEMSVDNFATRSYKYNFSKDPMAGDTITINYDFSSGGAFLTFRNEYVVSSSEQFNLSLLMSNLRNYISARLAPYFTVTYDSTSITIVSSLVGGDFSESSVLRTGNSTIDDDGCFDIEVPSMKIGDIARISFTGKGGNTEILMPDPGNLEVPITSNINSSIKVFFYLKEGQRYVIDNVYFQVPQNNDVYLIELPSSKNSKTEYTMEISSSFSGHLLSSYMNNYSSANQSMLWTGNKTLTQIYGETIMNWYNKPCRVFEGDVDVVRNWGLWSIRGVNYVPLSVRFDARDEISSVTAIEIRQDVQSYNVRHVSSDDKILEDWGGS